MAEIITLPSQRSKVTDDEGIFNTWWYNFIQDLWRGTRRNLGVKLGGTIDINTTNAENSGALETDLMSYKIDSGLFRNDGDYLEFIAIGDFSNNVNGKIIKIIFGSQTILQTNLNFANGGTWQIKGIIARKTSVTQSIICEILSNSSTLQGDSIYPVSSVDGTQDFSQDLILRTTGLGSADADITQKMFIIKFYSNS